MAKLCTIYEVRYFYAGLTALGLHSGVVNNSEIDQLIREELIKFNRKRNQKYTLPQRNHQFQITPRQILSELREYGLVEVNRASSDEAKHWLLTSEGWRIYQLVQNPANNRKLREEFMILSLNTFPEFRAFLKALTITSPAGLAGIPLVSERDFEATTPANLEEAISKAVSLSRQLMSFYFNFDETIYQQLRQELKTALLTRLSAGKKPGVAMETELKIFFLKHFFKEIFHNEVRYETLRTRCVFFGLVNY